MVLTEAARSWSRRVGRLKRFPRAIHWLTGNERCCPFSFAKRPISDASLSGGFSSSHTREAVCRWQGSAGSVRCGFF